MEINLGKGRKVRAFPGMARKHHVKYIGMASSPLNIFLWHIL